MKKISILGSTGSIGENTLKIVDTFPKQFQVLGLAAGKDIQRLAQQAKKFHPKIVAIADASQEGALKQLLSGTSIQVVSGIEGQKQVASILEVETVVSAIVGAAGLLPTIEALKSHKTVALAGKEVLVMAGALVKKMLLAGKGKLIPIDSEHSALLQALSERPLHEVKRLILTASGGPFLQISAAELENVTLAEALNHPRWKMGKKISIDSATMMNKGLEVIEARWLFDMLPEKIEILVHPESIIHSIVEFVDHSMIAQLSQTDMKIPIQYALTYPEHRQGCVDSLDLAQIGQLTFLAPDFEKFPVLNLAYHAARAGGTAPCVLNAANEVAVEAFLQEKIRFVDIPKIIEKSLENYQTQPEYSLEEILALDQEVRQKAGDRCSQFTKCG